STRFQLAALRDLFVRVQVANAPSMTVLDLEFTNPVGEKFYETRSLFSLDPSIVNIDDPETGPSRAFPMKSISGGVALDRSIPIGGTIFTRVPIPDGYWSLQASVAGVPGGLTTTFEMSWAP